MLEPTTAADRGSDTPIALWGQANLWEHGENLTLRVEIHGCKPAASYVARIQAGSDCSEQTLSGETWPGGDGIDAFACSGAGSFIAYYARREGAERPWTIGGARDSNVLDHALVLFDAETGQPAACGTIARATDALPSETTATRGPTLEIRAAIAGVCIFDRLVSKVDPDCPNYANAVECASKYCELDRCIDVCAPYVRCLAQARGLDTCMAAYSCEPTEKCSQCQAEVVRCEQDVCLETLSCGGPTRPDGACSQLLRCCTASNDDPAGCVELAETLAQFSGDAECQRLIDDWNVRGVRDKPCLPD